MDLTLAGNFLTSLDIIWLIHWIISFLLLFINDVMKDRNWYSNEEYEIRRLNDNKMNDVRTIIWFQFILSFLIFVWFNTHISIRIG